MASDPLPIDYRGTNFVHTDLINRLYNQADMIRDDGWLNASRLIVNVIDLLRDLEQRGVIILP